MVATAAHLVDHVLPDLPLRQWVLAGPERLRYSLQRDADLQGAALRLFLRVVEQCLRAHSPGSGPAARLGAVAFIHRFGSSLNAHLHFHCVVIDGVFDRAAGGVVFHAATGLDATAIAAVQAQVRRRLLRAFVRRGLLPGDDAQAMAQWEHGGGFSVDASVRIEAADRAGRERLLWYCTRPPFALDRLRELDPEHLLYESTKPGPGGTGPQILTPLPLLDRLAALVPPPRVHRHRYFGVLAPNAPLRAAVTALAPAAAPTPPALPPELPATEPAHRRAIRYAWALLLARIYEVFPLKFSSPVRNVPHGVTPCAQLLIVPRIRAPEGSSRVRSAASPAAGPVARIGVAAVMRRAYGDGRTTVQRSPNLRTSITDTPCAACAHSGNNVTCLRCSPSTNRFMSPPRRNRFLQYRQLSRFLHGLGREQPLAAGRFDVLLPAALRMSGRDAGRRRVGRFDDDADGAAPGRTRPIGLARGKARDARHLPCSDGLRASLPRRGPQVTVPQ